MHCFSGIANVAIRNECAEIGQGNGKQYGENHYADHELDQSDTLLFGG
ncbi:hypothetical protein LT85_4114 [Collimonas arenae]|uniref:Uncharacterized protein n=1 Tax=Collimonas arenae TaxID=279058 RepID=A0A0A1FK81_9BURK|nr:hypothetical protein LT85_4114 [Collimonas arenae]